MVRPVRSRCQGPGPCPSGVDRSPADHALRTETGRLAGLLPAARMVFWYERPGPDESGAREGLMNLDGVELPEDATVFLCGPLPLMREVRAQLLRAGVPAQRIRYEVFGPDLWLPGSAD
ncbi:hypothetical protein [Streptomyces sp. NPDC058741]|uniref:hypothetical protein n=1 Tax=Streptomyces sp. NPDC058741 TaxID=3346620 RepID=UPI00367AE72F